MARMGAEYFDPREGQGAVPVQAGRRMFLDRVAKVEPRVLGSLRETVLPKLQAAPRSPSAGGLRWSTLQSADAGRNKELAPLKDALRAWGARWRLSDGWALDAALSTVRTWANSPRIAEAFPNLWQPGAKGFWLPGGAPRPPALAWPEFEVLVESWESYQKRVRALFERELGKYREAVAAWAEGNGLRPAPEKRTRRGGDPWLHLEWLARYQVQELSYTRIADMYARGNANPSGHSGARTVSRAVRQEAARIRLTLRPPAKNQHRPR